jgi:hypothetical protein
MKAIAALVLALVLLAPMAVLAGNGNGTGNTNGQANGNGNAAANGNGQDNGNGNAGGNGNGQGNGYAGGNGIGANGTGVAFGHDRGAATPPPSDEGNAGGASSDQNIALHAVQSGAALPLDDIIPGARQRWGGRVIDATLIRIKGTLLYRLTMISDQGVSRRVYYDARSGTPVEVR